MTPRQVFRALPPWAWKVLSAFVGVVGVVWALGMTFGEEWSGLPAQVGANTAAIERLERADEQTGRDLQAIRRDVAFLRCWTIAPDSADARERLERCDR